MSNQDQPSINQQRVESIRRWEALHGRPMFEGVVEPIDVAIEERKKQKNTNQ